MKSIPLFFILVLFAGTFLTACTSSQTVSLTKADAGKTIDLKPGDEIEVNLEGNITTGYAWEAKDFDNTVIEMTGEPDYKSDSSLVGAGGLFTFRFRARAAGNTTLNLIYYRSFEPDVPPIETFNVTVNVR